MSTRLAMANARARIEIALWRHGWALPLAFATALMAIGLHTLVLVPTQAATQLAQAELARASTRAAFTPPPTAQQSAHDQQRERLASFHGLLRQSPTTGRLVRDMDSLAQANDIVLARSDYQYQTHNAIGLVQVQITQPVKAGYPQLRRYVEAVLRTMPNVSLDQIAVHRDNIGQAQVEARLRWSVWQIPAGATPDRSAP